MEIKQIKRNVYELTKEGAMKIAPRIYANEEIISVLRKEETNPNNSLKQLQNLSTLPGLVGAVCLADMHQDTEHQLELQLLQI